MGFNGDFMWISWDLMALVRKGTIVKNGDLRTQKSMIGKLVYNML